MASHRRCGSAVAFVVLLATVAGAQAEVGLPTGWVRIGNPADRQAVERALQGVAERLREGECRRVLGDFEDQNGRTLQEGLDALGLSPDRYLGWVFFYDGFGRGRCMQSGIYATTEPGSRVVHMCGPRFTDLHTRRPQEAEAVVLHEVLHTLGLGENPPTSAHITQRVVERCYPEVVASPFAKASTQGQRTAIR